MSDKHDPNGLIYLFIIVVVTTVATAYAIYITNRYNINYAAIYMSYLAYNTLDFLQTSGDWGASLAELIFGSSHASSEFKEMMREKYETTIVSYMTLSDVYLHFNFGFSLFRHMLLIPFTFLIYKSWVVYRIKKHKRVFAFEGLIHELQDEFPHLKVILPHDLLNHHPDKGVFRREVLPIRFAILNRLVTVLERNELGDYTGKTHTPVFTRPLNKNEKRYKDEQTEERKSSYVSVHGQMVVDIDRLRQLFVGQMGPKFTGIENMAPHKRALVAVFALYLQGIQEYDYDSDDDIQEPNDYKKQALDILKHFNNTWDYSKVFNDKLQRHKVIDETYIDFSVVDKIIDEFWEEERVQDIVSKHAYENTVITALLKGARLKGKLWTTLILWLKTVDRTLYYSLNQEGGQTGWTEAGGPRAHILAEREAKFPLQIPEVDQAVIAFIEELYSSGWLEENNYQIQLCKLEDVEVQESILDNLSSNNILQVA